MIGPIPVKVCLRMLVLLLQVVEYLGVIGLMSVQPCPSWIRFPRDLLPPRLDDQAPLTSRGVLGGDRVPLGFQENVRSWAPFKGGCSRFEWSRSV